MKKGKTYDKIARDYANIQFVIYKGRAYTIQMLPVVSVKGC